MGARVAGVAPRRQVLGKRPLTKVGCLLPTRSGSRRCQQGDGQQRQRRCPALRPTHTRVHTIMLLVSALRPAIYSRVLYSGPSCCCLWVRATNDEMRKNYARCA